MSDGSERFPVRVAVIARHYGLAVAAGAVAGLVGMVVTFIAVHRATCDPAAGPATCPDGIGYVIPTLAGGMVFATAALAGVLLAFTRGAGPGGVRVYAHVAMWLAALAVLLLWLVPTGLVIGVSYGGSGVGGVLRAPPPIIMMLLVVGIGSAPVAVGYALPAALPLVAGRVDHRAVVPVLVICLLAAGSVPLLTFYLHLVPIQLVPTAAACAGFWLTALVLYWCAGRTERRASAVRDGRTW